MKTLIITLLLVATLVGVAYAYCMTDWACVYDCQRQGYMWGYCKSVCTWCQ